MRCVVPVCVLLFIMATLLYTTHIGLDISHLLHSDDSSDLANLLSKPIDSWTDSERETFLRLKEVQYSERRQRVHKFCGENQEHFSNGTSRMALVYDSQDSVSYCAIPKVASSTWCWHFIQLGHTVKNSVCVCVCVSAVLYIVEA